MNDKYIYHLAAEETYHDGEVIFREGSPGDWLYLVLEGSVEIFKNVQDRKYILEILPPGELFGELEFIGAAKRTVSARAIGETTLGIIDREFLEKEFNQLSAQFRSILRIIARRFEDVLQRACDFNMRAEPRVAKVLSVEFKDHKAFLRAYTADGNLGGLFIKTENPLSPGDLFLIKLQVPGLPGPLQIKCEVLWARRPAWTEPNQPPGMGVKFCEISDRDQKALRKFLDATVTDT